VGSVDNSARQIPLGWPASSPEEQVYENVRVRVSVAPQQDSQELPTTLSPSRGSQSPDDNLGKVVTGQKILEGILPHGDGLEPSLAVTTQGRHT